MRWRIPIHDVVLKALGVLLVVAAVLKGHEPLTVPGAASCGCFGSVHVNPWITFSLIDLSAVVALSLFRPAHCLAPLLSFLRRQQSIRHAARGFLTPTPSSLPRLAVTATLGVAVLGPTTPILALSKPAAVTSTYEVLDPVTWIGKELPILKYVDVGEKLEEGTWLILLCHYDCPDCGTAIPKYEQMVRDLESNEGFLQIVFVAVPPYGRGSLSENSLCIVGKLNETETKEGFVATPKVALVKDGQGVCR